MVHLIGVGNHLFQHDAETPVQLAWNERAKFKAHVSEIIDKNDFALLAEEFSNEARTNAHATATWLQHFARQKGIVHRFCDPNSSERKERGIGESDDDKRERYWLERIEDHKDRNVLFVCGYDHFDSFAAKLDAAGFVVQCGCRMQRFTPSDLAVARWKQR
jgi:hypothetical protein